MSEKSRLLRTLIDSPGFPVLIEHIDTEIKEGWERFISLPVDKKTSKAAYDHQAQYKVLSNLKDWIVSQSKI